MLYVVIRKKAELTFLGKDRLILVNRAIAKVEAELRFDLVATDRLRRFAGRNDLPFKVSEPEIRALNPADSLRGFFQIPLLAQALR